MRNEKLKLYNLFKIKKKTKQKNISYSIDYFDTEVLKLNKNLENKFGNYYFNKINTSYNQKTNKKKVIFKISSFMIKANANKNIKYNFYNNLNISLNKIILFFKQLKNKKSEILKIKKFNKNYIFELNFDTNIFFYNYKKLILFEVENLLILDQYKRKGLEELLNYNCHNMVFGIFSKFSKNNINKFLKKFDPKRKFFKIILDNKFTFNNEVISGFKSLDCINLNGFIKKNIVIFDIEYNLINFEDYNLIPVPSIEFIIKHNIKNDNTIINIIQILDSIKDLKTNKISSCLKSILYNKYN